MTGRLGKREPRHDDRTLHLSRYITAPPAAPARVGWWHRTMPWGMLGNDRLGDCVFAARAHAILSVTTFGDGEATEPTEAQAVRAYELVAGYNPADPSSDRGTVYLDAMNAWRNGRLKSVDGDQIDAYASVGLKNLRYAIAELGPVQIGLAMPLSAQGQKRWTVKPGPDAQPGSWGGHAVPAVGYTRTGVWFITWGQPVFATNAFVANYMDEGYAVVSRRFLKAGRAPSGLDLPGLLEAAAAL